MSIDRTPPAAQGKAITAVQETRVRPVNQDTNQTKQPASDAAGTQVKLSAMTQQMTQQMKTDNSRDINHERVASVRAALDAGELRINPEKLVRALVQDVFRLH